MDDEIDIVVTGHTNWAVNCVIDGKVVTGAASQGRMITDIDFDVSTTRRSDIVGPTPSTTRDRYRRTSPKAAALTALVSQVPDVFAGPLANRVDRLDDRRPHHPHCEQRRR